MLRAILNIIRFPKRLYKKRIFEKNAFFSGAKGAMSVSIGLKANCVNKTESKNSISIGDNCDINAIIYANGKRARIIIGDYTTIRYDSMIGASETIKIGSHVIISNNVRVYDNNNHPTDPQKRIEMCESGFYSELWDWSNSEKASVTIGDNVWIGENSTILKGVTIGEGAVVGCCSVVTKDVKPYTIVAGNPAREVKRLK